MANQCVRLYGAIQSYAWGKVGTDSKVCEIYALNNPEFIPETKPYAELWLGVHPNGPSLIKDTKESLDLWIFTHPEVIGDAVLQCFGDKLPFLLKIISIQKPLSIQARPDKVLAEHLNALKPEVYRDDNHKPEMLIALSDFTAMCGFRPKEEIIEYLNSTPEIHPLVPEQAVNMIDEADELNHQGGLMQVFYQILTAPKELVEHQIALLKQRLAINGTSSSVERLVNELIDYYPADAGVFCPYLLNILHLKEGEAIFIAPNEPHSYISGDGVECMATSDNVVRAGLTEKLIDIETLVNMLSYNCRNAEQIKVNAVREIEFSTLLTPPVQDFAVAVVDAPPKSLEFSLPVRRTVSLLMIIEGDAKGNESLSLKKGELLLLPANFALKVSQVEQNPRLLMFQAFVNV